MQPNRASPNNRSGLLLKVGFYYPIMFMCINKMETMYERLRKNIKVGWGSTIIFMPKLSPLLFMHIKFTSQPTYNIAQWSISGGVWTPPSLWAWSPATFRGNKRQKLIEPQELPSYHFYAKLLHIPCKWTSWRKPSSCLYAVFYLIFSLNFKQDWIIPSSLLVSLGASPRSIENLTILGVMDDILLLKQ